MRNNIDRGEVILEFVQIGGLIRVSAMEPKSLTPRSSSTVRRAPARRPSAASCCASSTMSSAAGPTRVP